MKKFICFLFVLLFVTACNENIPVNTDQLLSELSPEKAGMSSERLALID